MSYYQHLKKDKRLALVLENEPFTLQLHENIALRLMANIMSQQLSTKVAEVFYRRFIALFGHSDPSPQEVLAIDYEILRSIGLSHAKATYVHNVANFCVAENITDQLLMQMSNEEVIALLTQIKGVGKWTVEMLLMFSLGREDIFPADDLGIQQAMIAIYKPRFETKNEMKLKLEKIATKWAPYRTYACLHLWAWKDSG